MPVRPRNQSILTEADLFIVSESGDYLVTEDFIPGLGGKRSKGVWNEGTKKDTDELWEIDTSVSSINDNALKKQVNIKKYIIEENDIKISISEDISLRKLRKNLREPNIINENITVTLLSTQIKE